MPSTLGCALDVIVLSPLCQQRRIFGPSMAVRFRFMGLGTANVTAAIRCVPTQR